MNERELTSGESGSDSSAERELASESGQTERRVYTPHQLATAIKKKLAQLPPGWVEGEVQGLHVSQRGHAYYELADPVNNVSLNCVVWAGRWRQIAIQPRNGDRIVCRVEQVSFWEKACKLQLVVDEIEPVGEGELLARARAIRERLEREGLTEPRRKLALPRFARRIGLIAGHESDAKIDVVRAIQTRFPPAAILYCQSAVQGAGAVGELIDALATLSGVPDLDVIVIARGGGSVQELAPFDDEQLCRAIVACGKPVVTSIGHTRHTPNCDLVASAAAPVPARVAELVVPDMDELGRELSSWEAARDSTLELVESRCLDLAERDLRGVTHSRLELAALRLESIGLELAPQKRLDELAGRVDELCLLAWQKARRRLPTLGELAEAKIRLAHELGTLKGGIRVDFARLDGSERELRDGPRRQLGGLRDQAALRGDELSRSVAARLSRFQQRLAHAGELLAARDPRARGLAFVRGEDGKIVGRAADLRPGELARLELADGVARVRVESVELRGSRAGSEKGES